MEIICHRSRQPSFLAFFIYISFHGFGGTVYGQCNGTAEQKQFSYDVIIVSTPGYDTGYSQNIDCQWLFTTPIAGEKILFRFANMYIDCGDGISAYDGTSSSASSLQSNTCDVSGATFTVKITTGPNLFVRFITDGTTNANEKGGQIEAIAGKDYSQCSSSTPIQLISSETEKPLSSPNFPSKYTTNQECTWVITASSSSAIISLNFKFLEIDLYNSNCVSYIKVYDGSTLKGNFCSVMTFSPTKSFTSTAGNTLNVTFHAGSFAKQGFLAVYSESGGTQTANQNLEPENSSCPQDTCVPAVSAVVAAAGITGGSALLFAAYKKGLMCKKKVGHVDI